MNREETRKAAEVMMHYANGGEVECRTKSGGTNQWIAPSAYSWDWVEVEYRIKPQPVEVTCYVVVSPAGGPQVTFMTKAAAENALRAYKSCFIVETKGTYTCDT